MNELQPTYNIGIIGPRTFIAGGHDKACEFRVKLRYKITQIICNIKEPYQLVGLTGLGLGVEQDFAAACNNLDIPYSSYLPYENMERKWIGLPSDIQNNFTTLLNNATGILYVSNGPYSPKKIEKKNQKVIDDSDLVIFINTPLSKYEYLLDKNKEVIKLNFWEFPI